MGLEPGDGKDSHRMREWGWDPGHPGASRAPLLILRHKSLIFSAPKDLPGLCFLDFKQIPAFGSLAPCPSLVLAPLGSSGSTPAVLDGSGMAQGSLLLIPAAFCPSRHAPAAFPEGFSLITAPHPLGFQVGHGGRCHLFPLMDSRSSGDSIKGRDINHVN